MHFIAIEDEEKEERILYNNRTVTAKRTAKLPYLDDE
ncbi:hypothetical protein T11_1964 [Trichinella zimbabwensis]|uniref:Uncharacterized protein n=1 Tax=Trichinella zimbabwensis TaxID=268475 RepID=A0A0V1GJY4_9BILA|nr:hypothetical protein T11_1964 [Trichinella zimbabwensis]